MIGGIDLGGTKIEARLFDDALNEVDRRRIPTPTASYDAMLGGVASQVAWLNAHGHVTAIGLGTPGLINPRSGEMLTANLPATGHPLAIDLAQRVGQSIPVINDCRAFTLSEATQGAGKPFRNVVGLLMGTGVAGGQTIDGRIIPDFNGQHGEYGHLPLPARPIIAHNLPLLPCGCGLHGCYETYLSGPGLVRLARHMTGTTATTQEILQSMPDVRRVWREIAAHLIALIARTCDPDLIVLGGGLGMITGLPDELTEALDGLLLANTTPPAMVQAQHGDASGALGAALFAQQRVLGIKA
jgi:predicted NBD/HSP70 family sugar kinase